LRWRVCTFTCAIVGSSDSGYGTTSDRPSARHVVTGISQADNIKGSFQAAFFFCLGGFQAAALSVGIEALLMIRNKELLSLFGLNS